MPMNASKLFKVLLHFLVVTLWVIYSTVAHWFSSNSKHLNKVVKLWLGSHYELPYSVSEIQRSEQELTQLNAAKSATALNSWSENCPEFLKNYPRSQKRIICTEKVEAQNSEASQTVSSSTIDSDKDAANNCEGTPQKSFKINPEGNYKAQKLSMLSIRAKLEEYNAINTQYVVSKHLKRHSGNEINKMQLNQLINSKELDYAVICKLMYPSISPLVLSKLNNSPKYRSKKHQKRYSFQPTKLSTIFENLAY